MIQATPFHPAFLTVAEYILTLKNWLEHTNRRMQQNPSLAALNCQGLAIPLTDNLHYEFENTPPWSELSRAGGRSSLYLLKGQIIQFLRKYKLYLMDFEIEHLYDPVNGEEFFPYAISTTLRDLWTTATGACYSKREGTEPEVCQSPIYAVWIIAGSPCLPNELQISRTHISSEHSSKLKILSRNPEDHWAWESLVREHLWQDIRLPFHGPTGLFGYRPSPDWEPSRRPTSTSVDGVSGYKDTLGGIWQWEGGRAQTNINPFGGHWNVQLVDNRARRNWTRWLEEVHQQEVRLQSNHINVEPDGRIVDRTFNFV